MVRAACAGAQWEKAQELFELMQQQHCTPDVVTYTALISAFERGGQWHLALQVVSHPVVVHLKALPFHATTF